MNEALSLKDKTLLITGGTGSFGGVVLERFLAEGIGQIRVFSRDEKKQEDMRLALRDDRVRFYIGDVREPDSIGDALSGVDVIFHAAALKQVPSCEFYPMEAVRTNILGTQNVLDSAVQAGVGHVIMLSTDKAVYPVNAMGMTKALMEKLTLAKARGLGPTSRTRLSITRYGNVMGSRGSVIPLFIQQIKAGQPVTVTDPRMTRFLMSLKESVDLVMYACTHCEQGDTFVQKAPASTIGTLAEALLDIFKSTVPINIIGTRHGEKRFETLVTREELSRSDDRGGYFRVGQDSRDLNYNKFFVEGETSISDTDDYTSDNTELLDREAVAKLLLGLDYIQRELEG